MTRVYTWLAGAVLLIAIGTGLYAWGRGDGRDVQAKDDAALIERKNAALRSAAAALGDSAQRFREIDAATAAAQSESRAYQRLAAEMAREAGKDTTALVSKIAALNATAERERETCNQAEMQICGSPLL